MITRRNRTKTGITEGTVYEGMHVKVNVVLRKEMKLGGGSLDENNEALPINDKSIQSQSLRK